MTEVTGFTTSDTTEHVWPAFCDALGKALKVFRTETADAGKFEFSYPKLTDVLGAVRGVLAEHGCVITQIPTGTPDGATWSLTTMILHPTGEWIKFDPYTRPQVRDEQGFGGAVTYGRRYSLTSIFAIGVADDDAAAVTEQQRNAIKYDGARTVEELSIRTVMATYPRHPLFIESFKQRFGRGLSDLPDHQHGEALRWTLEFFANPPEIPSDHDSEGESASPQADGAAPGQDSAPDPAPAPRKPSPRKTPVPVDPEQDFPE
jgi:hypothetical protein